MSQLNDSATHLGSDVINLITNQTDRFIDMPLKSIANAGVRPCTPGW